MTDAEHLRAYRKAKDWTQDQMAHWLGLESSRSVGGWERGENPVPHWVMEKITNDGRQLNPRMSLETFERAQQAAAKMGITLWEWIEGVIQEAAKNYEVPPPKSSSKGETEKPS